MRKLVFAATINLALIAPAYAGNTSTTTLDTKATIEGTCASFDSPKTDLHSCGAKVFYEHYLNHRVASGVHKTFSDLDERNDPTGEYKVGRRLYDNEGTPLGNNEVRASGDCRLTGDTSMMHIYRIVCSSRSGPGGRTGAMGLTSRETERPSKFISFSTSSEQKGSGSRRYTAT